MLSVRDVWILAISGFIVGQIAQPLGEKCADAVTDKLQRRKEDNNWTDVEETEK